MITHVNFSMNQTMDKLQKMNEAEYSSFVRVLFGLSSPSPVASDLSADSEIGNIEWIDPSLNDSQKDAIRFALASREVALIHGPPGVSQISSKLGIYLCNSCPRSFAGRLIWFRQARRTP